jgi:hypothetical protein
MLTSLFLLYQTTVLERLFLLDAKQIQLSATDLLALASMKNAAKCDK